MNLTTDGMSTYATVADALLKWKTFQFNNGITAVGGAFALGASAQGIKFVGSASAIPLGGNFAHVYCGIRVKFQSGYGSAAPAMFSLCDGANAIQVCWGRNVSGTLFLARGGFLGGGSSTTLATSTFTVAAGSTHYIELEGSIASSGGVLNLYVDSVLYATFTGNTQSTGNAFCNNVMVYAGNGGAELWCTDLYVNDPTTAICNGILGPVDITPLKMTGAGAHADFSRGGVDTGTNVGQLNKATVSTNSFNTDFVVGHRDDFTPAALGSGTILGARLWAYGQKDGGGVRDLALTCTSGATDRIGANQSVSGPGYGWYSQDESSDPATGALWATLAALNGAKYGYKLTV